MRNYFLIIGSTSFFDDYINRIDTEKDSFIELVRQDDTQRKGGVITWDPSPNLVVRNSDYHGIGCFLPYINSPLSVENKKER